MNISTLCRTSDDANSRPPARILTFSVGAEQQGIMNIRVECYSGRKADERPIRFWLGDGVLFIESIVDQWYRPDAPNTFASKVTMATPMFSGTTKRRTSGHWNPSVRRSRE
jgi:hypothetical protein